MPAWIDSFVADARIGLRHSFRKPGFVATCVLTLALGIGANTAMFSVVYGVLLKPLPFDEPDRLVSIRSSAPGIGWTRAGLAAAQYFTYRDENRTFEDVAVFQSVSATISGDGEPDVVPTLMVTDGFLPILRVAPTLGRRFSPADDAPGSPRRAILSYGFWQRRFGGRPDIVGHAITVNGAPCEIIGVLPRSFAFGPDSPALMMTLGFDRARTTIINFSFPGIARLRPGVSLEQATRDVARMIPMTSQKFPPSNALGPSWFADAKMGPDLRPFSEEAIGDARRLLWVLMGTVGIVFVIACVNVANLFLVRADARRRELAVRAALGAGRWRITRALVTETLLTSAAGGAIGVALAAATIRLVRVTAPRALPRVGDIALDPAVLAFAAALSLGAGLALGLLPAVRLAQPGIGSLNDGGRGSSEGRSRQRVRSGLVIAEITLAVVLLIASGLMIRTFDALGHVDPGFQDGGQLLAIDLTVPRASAPSAEATLRRHEEIIEKLKQIPGVRAVGLTSSVPMDGSGMSNPLIVEEFPVPEGQAIQSRRMKWISPGYFETMKTRVVSGRLFTWAETYAFAPVVVLNERLVRQYWKTPAEAVGKRVRETVISPWREVVGVVADERQDGLAQDPPPIMYWPCMVNSFFGGQPSPRRGLTYLIRSARTGDQAFLDEVRRAVHAVDSGLPIARVRTVDEIVATSMAQTSFAMVMLAIAAAVSLLLGVVGIYGVVSYVAAQRTREIGVRMALGAAPGDVALLCARHGLVLAAVGLLLGVAAAAALSSVLTSLLFGVERMDPLSYAVGTSLLGIVAAVATYVPSRRAARMQPVAALRSDVG
jgi:putative ABC transport system permease protein